MPSWSQLLKIPIQERQSLWLATLKKISELRKAQSGNDRHVIFYASGFLQKPQHSTTMIAREDINGFMNAFYRIEEKSLTLILHTPGGDVHAVENIVNYLHSKYDHIEVIVPAFAMSGGAMMSLASDHLVMSKAAQLGPFDPQMLTRGGRHSTRAIQDGFDAATTDILGNPGMANVWAHILRHMGPSLLMEARKSLSHSKQLVSKWLASEQRQLLASKERAERITAYFNAEPNSGYGQIYMHGHGIGWSKLHEMGLNVTQLESDDDLQEQVMTAYHLMTLIFEQGTALKFIASDKNGMWIKNEPMVPGAIVPPPPQ